MEKIAKRMQTSMVIQSHSPEAPTASAPTTSIPPGSVNEYQLRLGRQRQVWFIPLADERGVCRCIFTKYSSSHENACHTWAPCVHDKVLYKSTFTFTFTMVTSLVDDKIRFRYIDIN